MSEKHPSEVLNNGLTFKFLVPAGDLDDIEQFVGKYVRVNLGGNMEIIGDLKRVSSWTKKEGGEVIGVYQELTIEIECIAAKEGEIRMPDKKCPFVESFSICYATE